MMRRTPTPSSTRTLASRSWVRGRSASTPCSFMAMDCASQLPIQMGRYRSPLASRRMTTCWVDSVCTRTLSTTISRIPWGMGLILAGAQRRLVAPATGQGWSAEVRTDE